jgi:hypothetical protein
MFMRRHRSANHGQQARTKRARLISWQVTHRQAVNPNRNRAGIVGVAVLGQQDRGRPQLLADPFDLGFQCAIRGQQERRWTIDVIGPPGQGLAAWE